MSTRHDVPAGGARVASTEDGFATVPPLNANHNVRLLWAGEGVSVLGAMTTSVVLPLVAITGFGAGPGWMGAIAAATWLPWLLLGLVVGAVVDRTDPRRVMIAADLAAAAAITTVPLAWWFGVLGLVQLAAVAFATGACSVFFRTAYTALIPRVARPEDLPSVNARLVGTEAAMQVAGPGLGGVLVQILTAAYAVVADALSFLVSAFCLWRMDTRAMRPGPEPAGRLEPLGTSIREGVRVVAADPYLRFFSLQGGASNFALTGYGALLVLFLVRDLRLDPGSVGLALGLGSVGGLLGSIVATRVSRRLGTARGMVALQVLGGPPALLIAAAQPGRPAILVTIGIALVGVGVVGANVIRGAFRQRYTPPELMGRTTATSAVLNFGTMPLAGVAAGWLGTHLGVRETIALMAALHAVACLAAVLGPYGRGMRDLPTTVMPARAK